MSTLNNLTITVSCIVLFIISFTSFTMDTIQQIFCKKTAQIALLEGAAVIGYYALHRTIKNYLTLHSDHSEGIDNSEYMSDEEDLPFLSWRHNCKQAAIMGTILSCASRFGPWKKLDISHLAVPTFILYAGIGISSFFYKRIHLKSNFYCNNPLIEQLLHAKACITSAEIIFPLTIILYRINQSERT